MIGNAHLGEGLTLDLIFRLCKGLSSHLSQDGVLKKNFLRMITILVGGWGWVGGGRGKINLWSCREHLEMLWKSLGSWEKVEVCVSIYEYFLT